MTWKWKTQMKTIFQGIYAHPKNRQNHKPKKLGQDKVHKWTLGRMKGEISFLICSLVFPTWSLRHPGVKQPQGTSSLKEAAEAANALTGTKGFYIHCFSAEIFRQGFVSSLGNHDTHVLDWHGRCGRKAARLNSSFRKVWDKSPSVGFWSYFTCLWPNTD